VAGEFVGLDGFHMNNYIMVKECHKPSPSHHQKTVVFSCFFTIPSHGWFTTLFYPIECYGDVICVSWFTIGIGVQIGQFRYQKRGPFNHVVNQSDPLKGGMARDMRANR